MIRNISLIVIIFITFVSSTQHIAKTGLRDDVQTTINRAAAGDTVLIPKGSFVFNGGVTIKSGITIKGAGRDLTTLYRTASTSAWMFTVDCSAGGSFTLTGMTIAGVTPQKSPGIIMKNNCKDFRIYDNTFKKCNDRAIEIHGNTRGVIDHNTFVNNDLTAVVVFGDGNGGWTRPLKLGSSEAVFIEDNYFRQDAYASENMHHHVASNNGSMYVFRYNTIDDGNLASSGIDVHGNKFYWPRGSRGYEIYRNKISAQRRWVLMNIRGGDGVIFENIIRGSYSYPIHLIHESDQGDGNCNYPCEDQIRKLYIWDNTINSQVCEVKSRYPEIVKINRDYFLNKMPNYTPYTYPHPLTNNLTSQNNDMETQKITDQMHFNVSRFNFADGNIKIDGTILDEYSGKQMSAIVYNPRGELVRTLTCASVKNGNFQIEWDGRNENRSIVSNGLYTIMINIGSYVKSYSVVFSR